MDALLRLDLYPSLFFWSSTATHRIYRLTAKNFKTQYLDLFFWERGRSLRLLRQALEAPCVRVWVHVHLWSPGQHPPLLHHPHIWNLDDCCHPPPLSTFFSAGGTSSTLCHYYPWADKTFNGGLMKSQRSSCGLIAQTPCAQGGPPSSALHPNEGEHLLIAQPEDKQGIVKNWNGESRERAIHKKHKTTEALVSKGHMWCTHITCLANNQPPTVLTVEMNI